jgi:hypothetical protein
MSSYKRVLEVAIVLSDVFSWNQFCVSGFLGKICYVGFIPFHRKFCVSGFVGKFVMLPSFH